MTEMTSSASAALTAVFPLILLVLVFESRGIMTILRKTNWYTFAVGLGSMLSLAGLLLTVIGVQSDGLLGLAAICAWAVFGISLAALLIATILVALTYDAKDGRESKILWIKLDLRNRIDEAD